MGHLKKLVAIHCSDSPNDNPITAADIHEWHQQKGWDGIGYHHVITRDGRDECGRPEYWTGAHCKGHNRGSIGICLVGRDSFTDTQYHKLSQLLLELTHRYGELNIKGHCELDPGKTCPNQEVMAFIRNLEVAV